MWINTRAFRFAASCITLWLSITLFASFTWAQTPDALDPTPTEAPVIIDTPVPTATTVPTEPVVTVEPEEPTSQPEPEPTQAPTEPPPTEAPAATEAPAPTSTQQPTEEPAEPEPTATSPAPTPTEIPEVPDQLQLVTSADITINPGEQRDVVIRYTLGSDRSSTKLSVNLTAPGGESLAGWSVDPVGRADLHQDVDDPAHLLKAGIAFADLTGNGDSFETTWRVSAPDHVELPFTIRLHANAEVHIDGGVSAGATQNDLLTIHAAASAHQPSVTCDATESNSWGCVFNTAHPDANVGISASAELPAGWELSLDGTDLTSEPMSLGAETIVGSGFSLAASYPVGCPDGSGSATAMLNLNMTYPSGEVAAIDVELPVIYEKPESMLTISSFGFNEVDLRRANETTGHLTLSHNATACGWEATIQLTDLESENLTIPSDAIRIDSIHGLPNAAISLDQGVITIRTSESDAAIPAGELTINFAMTMPAQVEPGEYRIGVNTQFTWLAE